MVQACFCAIIILATPYSINVPTSNDMPDFGNSHVYCFVMTFSSLKIELKRAAPEYADLLLI